MLLEIPETRAQRSLATTLSPDTISSDWLSGDNSGGGVQLRAGGLQSHASLQKKGHDFGSCTGLPASTDRG